MHSSLRLGIMTVALSLGMDAGAALADDPVIWITEPDPARITHCERIMEQLAGPQSCVTCLEANDITGLGDRMTVGQAHRYYEIIDYHLEPGQIVASSLREFKGAFIQAVDESGVDAAERAEIMRRLDLLLTIRGFAQPEFTVFRAQLMPSSTEKVVAFLVVHVPTGQGFEICIVGVDTWPMPR